MSHSDNSAFIDETMVNSVGKMHALLRKGDIGVVVDNSVSL